MIWRRKRMLQGFDLDIEDHIRRETQENVDRGIEPDEARFAALRTFGNVARIQEEVRDVWRFVWLDHLSQDLRYALRVLWKNPGFATVAILTLALGIGMNTAVFSVVHAVLLQPVPYPDPERLTWISQDCPLSSGDCMVARTDYLMYREESHAFESMALMSNDDYSMVYHGEASTERVGSIEGDFWTITNSKPALGQVFRRDDTNVAVLTWELYQRKFGADPRVVGKAVTIEGHSFTVVGVLPATFRNLFPQANWAGDELREIDAYIPTTIGHELPGDPVKPAPIQGPCPPWFRIVGKLRSGVSFAQALPEMQVISQRVFAEHPNPYSHRQKNRLLFETLDERLASHARPALLILLGAVGFVLLIAIVNIANLLLARASTREREIAIRVAIGAGRMRVVRQFLAESTTLALLGGAAGLALAQLSLGVIKRFGTAIPRLDEAHIDGSVMGFAFAVSCLTGILFGLAPALTIVRESLDEILRHDARTSSVSASKLRLRGFLVAAEVALALILLVGAGLMLKSFRHMSDLPSGMEPDRILTMRLSLSGPRYDHNWPQQSAYLDRLSELVQSLPGVVEFGIDCGRFQQPVKIAGVSRESGTDQSSAAVRYVSPGYLRAMGMPLREGRWPTRSDMFDFAIVNEQLVREAGVGDIVGRLLQGTFIRTTVAGVVPNFKDWQLDAEPVAEVYAAYPRAPVVRSVRVVLRTSGDPLLLAPALRKLTASIDRDVPVFQLQTLQQELANSVAPRRFSMALLATFAGTAVLLALIGVYGVIAYLVAQRTAEIGIRVALGAGRTEIVKMVMGQGMGMVVAGIVGGLIGAISLTRLMAAMLYRVATSDPETYLAVAAILAITGLLACLAPAIRAARVDPLLALRTS
ncbi:MAG TPA: ABC transporter permease [Bryobacteraceae bacterium]|nr:ABC transporter permease [Bryobacteraceae bacterium]